MANVHPQVSYTSLMAATCLIFRITRRALDLRKNFFFSKIQPKNSHFHRIFSKLSLATKVQILPTSCVDEKQQNQILLTQDPSWNAFLTKSNRTQRLYANLLEI